MPIWEGSRPVQDRTEVRLFAVTVLGYQVCRHEGRENGETLHVRRTRSNRDSRTRKSPCWWLSWPPCWRSPKWAAKARRPRPCRAISRPPISGRSSRPRQSARPRCARLPRKPKPNTRTPPGMPAAMKAQVEQWRNGAALRDRARDQRRPQGTDGAGQGARRSRATSSLAAYHMFEYASACFQLAIVLAGAAALTAVMWLTFVSVGLGLFGTAFTPWLPRRRPWSTSSSANEKRPGRLPRASFETLVGVGLSAAPAAGRRGLRHLGLLVGRRIVVGRRRCARFAGRRPRRGRARRST